MIMIKYIMVMMLMTNINLDSNNDKSLKYKWQLK